MLVYQKANYMVDKVLKAEDYAAMGSPRVADMMRKQKIKAELIVFKPSTERHRSSVAKPERRHSMKLYETGLLGGLESKTLGRAPAGRVV